MTSGAIIMQSIHFTPVCVDFQQKIREHFGWELRDDENVFNWLQKNISKYNTKWDSENQRTNLEQLIAKIKSKTKFAVIGANITESELFNLSDDVSLIVADGSIGSLIEVNEKLLKNVICLVSDGDGVPHINNEKIGEVTLLLHAHGHAKENLQNILEIWSKWEKKPKIIISHQTFNTKKPTVNFGGFSDGDRAVCMLHACGVEKRHIQLLGFNAKKIGPWSGLNDSKIKQEKLIWMKYILEELGYDI